MPRFRWSWTQHWIQVFRSDEPRFTVLFCLTSYTKCLRKMRADWWANQAGTLSSKLMNRCFTLRKQRSRLCLLFVQPENALHVKNTLIVEYDSFIASFIASIQHLNDEDVADFLLSKEVKLQQHLSVYTLNNLIIRPTRFSLWPASGVMGKQITNNIQIQGVYEERQKNKMLYFYFLSVAQLE